MSLAAGTAPAASAMTRLEARSFVLSPVAKPWKNRDGIHFWPRSAP